MRFRRGPMGQLIMLHPGFVMPSGRRFRLPRPGVERVAEGAAATRSQDCATEEPTQHHTEPHCCLPFLNLLFCQRKIHHLYLSSYTIDRALGAVKFKPKSCHGSVEVAYGDIEHGSLTV